MEAPHVMNGVMEDGPAANVTPMFGDQIFDSFDELDRCDGKNPFFNCSLQEYLLYILGPQQLALSVAVPITVVYVLIFVTGVVGNVSVCIVIVRHPSMRTATNYYLFSLAVSDLTLLLLGLPNDISIYWHQYPYSLGIGFCKLRALLSEASSYVSVLTIVAFSMERYLAICHPLHLYTMSGLQRPVRIIAALWTVSLVCAMPFFLHTTINYLDYPPNSNNTSFESAFCAMLTQPYGWPVWEMSSIVFFLLPAFVILVLYCRMGLRIRARSRNHLGKGVKGSVHGETRQTQSRKAIIRMLAAVVVAFFLCWAPFHAQRLIYIYGQDWTHFKDINEWMFSVTGWLYYISSTVNPILYNVMSNRYRVAFRETLCCKRKHSHNGIGFSREQSSFRETTIAASGEGSHLVRVRSVSSEPLHRANTTSRLSRHATVSKDYNLNHNPQKTRWNDNSPGGKKWNNNDARGRKSPTHSPFKGMFSNFNAQEANEANYKRTEITLETETNNLLNANKEDYEMDNIKKYNNTLKVENTNANIRLPDSASQILNIAENKNTTSLNDFTIVKLEKSNIQERQRNLVDPITQIQDGIQVVATGKSTSNGLKKFPHKNVGFSSRIVGPHDDSCAEDISEENKNLKEISDTSETRI